MESVTLGSFFLETVTPISLALGAVALILTSFARGWIVSKATVEIMIKGYEAVSEQSNKRANDFQEMYHTEKERGDILQGIVEKLTVIGETSARILDALPSKNVSKESKKVQ
jgi:hypothetical protein